MAAVKLHNILESVEVCRFESDELSWRIKNAVFAAATVMITQCLSYTASDFRWLTRVQSCVMTANAGFNWQDQHQNNFIGVDVISSCCVVDRPQEMPSASFFLTSLGEFLLHQVVQIYIYIYFSFFPGLPLADFLQWLATQKKRSNPCLPMGQSVERKWSEEWSTSGFQYVIRGKK